MNDKRSHEGAKLADQIRAGQLDCAVMHLPSLSTPDDLLVQEIQACGMCVMVHDAAPLAHFNGVTIEQISRETDVRISRETSSSDTADNAFRALGLHEVCLCAVLGRLQAPSF